MLHLDGKFESQIHLEHLTACMTVIRLARANYLLQDGGESLQLTVDDDLALLPFVQVLKHFEEGCFCHCLHVHGGHKPVMLCCCVQNLLQN